ncbi:bifunctional tRNA (5-methylaminomethyl-2-thiouridine)(34)-methyltransferase MnmD/FAD-dependent 5-carboxymethylaminomethyl-2-thiouridine(34) oxidoreductase MnmC [Alteromonas lipolytica]|uniref:tRNA 5-methylaminomethyl-2-thiouridine biosynthesis bifunctional protein MnmC n=1 Tax=Alteromonas lipolytica TaxID=1856405 RepID=A0A1E8FFR3_9ALTE|nr:bifunctional tRNA (5-methylaminomethyl-2-thiouridine)(34)-methyltransferase MnmD/FAD-dependent 5-carboxymethylaminomethyl-2-thiouridine(34) oxidoreductase MnmC [Alteromonas lipolytica]OFI34754.1 methyltransferase [Alteromonas lipolytica]GGF53722.1 tRNA 5-methylaminomethyl-2-thiouridine biosynthesis bifunctional protein MnmC [Alteromonas lipolytica]
MSTRLQAANVHFNEAGTPVADSFDDVYFSNDSGCDETLHVFINGNDLTERWLTWQAPHFVIGETGFGTGLNCLIAMQAFKQFRASHPDHPLKQLYIVSTEKFPIAVEDLKRALAVFPAVAEEVNALVSLYPPALPGCHRLDFTAWHTCVDLWMGDVHELLPQWHCPLNGLIDAWFLDGFAPSKNPDMWTDALFGQMARLSKTGATFATFTAAGIVKRGLKEAGFAIVKRKGFGRKRDMLTGYLATAPARRVTTPWHYRYPATPATTREHIAIIGAGLAGSTLALALCQRGIKVSLFGHGSAPADGASGNRQGGFYPQLQADQSNPALIQAHGFLYAKRHYDGLTARELSFTYDNCGVLLLGFSEEVTKRQQNLLAKALWPEQLIHPVSADEACAISGIDIHNEALFVPAGGWLCPAEVVGAQLTAARQTGLLQEFYDSRLSLTSHQDTVVLSNHEKDIAADRIVIAAGHECTEFEQLAHLPLRPVRGQVEAIPTQQPLNQLTTVLCHKGYLTPGWQGRHALGSTYVKGDTDTTVRETETGQNLATHAKALADYDWAHSISHDNTARASVRLGSADHQPIVGSVINPATTTARYRELYKGKHVSQYEVALEDQKVLVMTALGSRGLTTAPLMAEILASQLCHQPLPMSETLLQALAPERFMLRTFKRPPEETE